MSHYHLKGKREITHKRSDRFGWFKAVLPRLLRSTDVMVENLGRLMRVFWESFLGACQLRVVTISTKKKKGP